MESMCLSFALTAVLIESEQPSGAGDNQCCKAHKRPIGNAAAKKRPIDMTAIAVAGKELRNGAA